MARDYILYMSKMKLITTILVVTMLFWGCKSKKKKDKERLFISNPTEKIELREEIEWTELEGFIRHFADRQPSLKAGKDTIIEYVREKFPSFKSDFLLDIDFEATKEEFIHWLKIPLLKSPPDNEIKAFYFGLFTSSDPELSGTGEEIKVLYLAGSITTPEEDSMDWAVDPDYFPPERYCVLTSFIQIERELSRYKNTSELEQILFNGITNLILVNSMDEIKKYSNRSGVYVGSGFDSGPNFLIGKTE